MSAIATPRDRPRPRDRPALRLVPGRGEGGDPIAPPGPSAELRLVEEGPCILVVGADPQLRASVRRELAEALTPGTLFEEAGMVWEVLEQASRSGVVMLTGDLRDATAAALTRLLAQRHPRLPIVALDAPKPLDAPEPKIRTSAGGAPGAPGDPAAPVGA